MKFSTAAQQNINEVGIDPQDDAPGIRCQEDKHGHRCQV